MCENLLMKGNDRKMTLIISGYFNYYPIEFPELESIVISTNEGNVKLFCNDFNINIEKSAKVINFRKEVFFFKIKVSNLNFDKDYIVDHIFDDDSNLPWLESFNLKNPYANRGIEICTQDITLYNEGKSINVKGTYISRAPKYDFKDVKVVKLNLYNKEIKKKEIFFELDKDACFDKSVLAVIKDFCGKGESKYVLQDTNVFTWENFLNLISDNMCYRYGFRRIFPDIVEKVSDIDENLLIKL